MKRSTAPASKVSAMIVSGRSPGTAGTSGGPASASCTNWLGTPSIAAQVISRLWTITDANNHVENVRGLGVVGHQPLLQPGEQFDYTSGSSLSTPHGSMIGEYFCVAEDGEQFVAKIPEFVLSLPRTLH